MLSDIIHLPTRRVIRIALLERGMTVSEWARRNGYSPDLTIQVIGRYQDQSVQLDRTWGETRKILLDLHRLAPWPERSAA